MKKLFVMTLILFGIIVSGICFLKPDTADAVLCIKTGERISGLNKICYYNCTGSEYAITIGSCELCPLTINN
jgi:hypothetical protein